MHSKLKVKVPVLGSVQLNPVIVCRLVFAAVVKSAATRWVFADFMNPDPFPTVLVSTRRTPAARRDKPTSGVDMPELPHDKPLL